MRRMYGRYDVTIKGTWSRGDTERLDFTNYRRIIKTKASLEFGAELSARLVEVRPNGTASGTFTFKVPLYSSNNAASVAAGLLAAVAGSVTCRSPLFEVQRVIVGRYHPGDQQVAI